VSSRWNQRVSCKHRRNPRSASHKTSCLLLRKATGIIADQFQAEEDGQENTPAVQTLSEVLLNGVSNCFCRRRGELGWKREIDAPKVTFWQSVIAFRLVLRSRGPLRQPCSQPFCQTSCGYCRQSHQATSVKVLCPAWTTSSISPHSRRFHLKAQIACLVSQHSCQRRQGRYSLP
jgi:hypothetical protein